MDVDSLQPTIESAHKRPIGVTILSGLAFLASAFIAFEAAYSAYESILFASQAAKAPFARIAPLGYVLIFLAWLCLVTLGWIAFFAGLDLWRMRSRGRKLTLVAMLLILSLGIFSFAAGSFIGIGLCVIAICSIGYLSLRSVRNQFSEQSRIVQKHSFSSEKF